MHTIPSTDTAARVAELTFQLLVHCQVKESAMADEFGMSPSQLRAVRLFRGHKHLLQKELVDRVGLSGSRLTRIIDRLQEGGWVTRAEDPEDRRGVVVFLTAKGQALVDSIEQRSAEIHTELLLSIPADDQAGLIASLEQMLHSLEGWARHQSSVERE